MYGFVLNDFCKSLRFMPTKSLVSILVYLKVRLRKGLECPFYVELFVNFTMEFFFYWKTSGKFPTGGFGRFPFLASCLH